MKGAHLMFKRIISLLLCFAMAASFLPANAFPARAEETEEPTGWIHMEWTDGGEAKQWDISQDLSALPSGVTYDPDSLTLTLNGANLTWLNFNDFYDQAIHLVVEGSNTITGDTNALNFANCANVALSGSGTLNLTASEYPFGWHDYNGATAADYNTDGVLTIRELTLNCTNLRTQAPEGHTDEEWNFFTPITLAGGNIHITDNAKLTCEGLGFIGVSGDLVVDGGAVVNGSGLHCNPWGDANDDSLSMTPSVTVAEGGTINLYRVGRTIGNHSLFWLSPGSSLIMDGGTLTFKEFNEDCEYNVISTGEAENGRPGGSITFNSGELKIETGNHVHGTMYLSNGCSYVQNGGNLTIIADRNGSQGFEAINVGRGGSFTLNGGTITVENAAGELAPDSWVTALHVDKYASDAVITGGEVNTSGLFSQDIALDGKMTVSGGEVNVRIIEAFMAGANLTQVGGTVNSAQYAARWGGQLQMIGGTFNTEYLVMESSYARFLGGETNITQALQVHYMEPQDALSCGSGIHALYADSGEPISFADAEGEEAYSGKMTTPIGRTVSIKRQGLASDSFSGLLELMNVSSLTAGTEGTLRLITSLNAPSADVTVTLPDGLTLAADSVTVNGETVPYTENDNGFTVNILNGEIVRFGVIPSREGQYTVEAQACGNTLSLDVTAKAFTLAIPTAVNSAAIPVSGTAAPGAQLTFYINDAAALTVKANALGTWSAKLPLTEGEGDYTVFADVAVNGITTRSGVYTVTYDDNAPVVKTLTITNTIHGNTSADPNQEVSVVIDYESFTGSKNYYTYWPELPDFRFAAQFENGTPETVSDVYVVATDYFGATESVPLRYDAATGLWIGEAEFCGDGDIVPEMFRVQWRPLETETEEPVPDETEPALPEPFENNYTEDAMVTSDTLTYTFALSGDAEGLSVTDHYGNEVTVTDNTFTGETGVRYHAVLTAGTFSEFGTQSLWVLMPGTGESSYELMDNVHTEEATGYSVGDVVIVGETASIITAVNDDGTYAYTDATLEDVFASLQMDGLSVSEDDEVIVDGDMEEALTQAFLESDAYAAYVNTVEAYGEAEQLGAFGAPEVDVSMETKLTNGENGTVILTLTPEFTVSSKSTAKLPGGSAETAITFRFQVEAVREFDLRIDKDQDGFHGASFYVDSTNTVSIGVIASIKGKSSTAVTEELKEYFAEEWKEATKTHEFLESLTGESDQKVTAPICNVRVPTNIPFLFVEMGLDIELLLQFSGSASLNASVSNGDVMGIVVNADYSVKPYYKAKDTVGKIWAEFHVFAKTGVMLNYYAGPRLLNLLTFHFNLSFGPALKAGGHGTATLSSNEEETGVKAEWWVGITFDYKADVTATLNLVKNKISAEYVIGEGSFPLAASGSDRMPFRYTVVEDEKYVYDGCDITKFVTKKLDYQTFANGLQTKSDVLEEENYEYKFQYGKFSLNGNTLTVNNPLAECEDWVELWYTCPSGSYQVIKRVKLLYSPSSIVIHKSACCAPPVAGFQIEEISPSPDHTPFSTGAGTDESGIVVVPVPSGRTYRVTEISAPPEHYCVSPETGYHEVYVGNSEVHVSFANEKRKQTPDFPLPSNGDPSGYVFEGIESNRLEGVTVTLYRSNGETGADAVQWGAAEYDQVNPLVTDELGQYMWMVPSGWYQVRYSLDGYEAESSDWMVVPPIRTGVNQAMTSYAPAEYTVFYSEALQSLVLQFNRPVMVAALQTQMTVNGTETQAWTVPVDAAWSVTEDPADSTVCATTFLLGADTELAGTTVDLTVTSVTYAGVESTAGSTGTNVPLPPVPSVIRLSGKNRYDTAFAVANQLKSNLKLEQFEAVVVAYGQNFPDALTGSYLAAVKNAPILLTEKSADARVLEYIQTNLVPGGTVYILGGTAAVTQKFEDGANELGFTVKRLKDKNRYGTNLKILEEAGVNKTDEILIATGTNYADSLSASATGLPMLLVGGSLTEEQKAFLKNTSGRFVIIGGTGAVSQKVEDQLNEIGTAERVKGKTRYETSVVIAQRYFGSPKAAVLAYAQGFPDGLCGGPLAMNMGAPLILTSNESPAAADAYIEGITVGAVTGGTGRITDDTVRAIFDLAEDVQIPTP